jgi:hypothetical protein
MNEEFENLKSRLVSADPAKDVESVNESVVAAAPLNKPARTPLGKRFRQFAFSGSLLATAGAFAMVVTLAMPQQPLIRMADSGAANSSPMAAGMSVESDAKMMWPGFVQYEYDTTALGDNSSSGRIYQLQLNGSPEQKLRLITDYFGLDGDIRLEEWSTPEYPSYAVGKDSNVAGVSWAGTGNWYYSFWDDSSFKCENKLIELEDGSSYESCEPILTPELVPSEEQMKAQATEVFTALGMSVTESQLRVSRSEWGGSVNAAVQIDGQETALEWGVSWDGAGRLSYAFGHFAEIVDRGEYGTVSPKAAAERIKDGRWFGSPASAAYNFGGAPTARTMDLTPAVEPAEGDAMTSDAMVGEEPVAPMEPEIVTLKLESSTEALLMIFDRSGGAWLVPGYLLNNDQGWFDSIIALEEGIIELPEPYEVGIMPIEDAPTTKQD